MSRDAVANKKWLNASTFRIVLSVSLLMILVLSSAGFTFAHQVLSNYADEIARKKVDAITSNDTISSLRKVQQTIEQNQQLIDKIDTLRADDTFPEFLIVEQIKTIAKRNNISISNYSFGSSEADSTSGASTQPAAGQQPMATTKPLKSSDTVTLTINFGSVSSYKKYLQFLYDIEQNVPKMRIKGVGVSSSSGESQTNTDGSTNDQTQTSGSNGFTVDPLVVEMYVK